MAPNPIETTHVIKVFYTQNGLTHHQVLYVNAQTGIGPTGYDLLGAGASLTEMQDAIDQWEAVTGPVLGSGTAAAGFILYLRSGTVLIPIYNGTYSFTAVGGAVVPTSQVTLCFRDSNNALVKVVLLECNVTVPGHATQNSGLGTALSNLINAYLAESGSNVGVWSQSRGDKQTVRFVSYTASLNRRVRRRRGLA